MATPSETAPTRSSPTKLHAIIDYQDSYVQPLILEALQTHIPAELLDIISLDSPEAKTIFDLPERPLLQIRQYESLDFDHLLAHPTTSFANSYVIRKALIRKHYLSATTAQWVAKHPESALNEKSGGGVVRGVEFEVDFAEFLDDALDEADGGEELREFWRRNEEIEAKGSGEKEWWILKPGMSERGQGIRLFSSEEELREIFEGWDPEDSDDEADEEETSDDHAQTNGSSSHATDVAPSHLRHFLAQPYIHPPFLLPSPHPCAGRKFHIRTYVLAVGALKVFVYKRMLALFAGEAYVAPGSDGEEPNDVLARHLTNTCLQGGEARAGSVMEFWDLPALAINDGKKRDAQQEEGDWKDDVFSKILSLTSEMFLAAARTMSTHFQPLPNAFEAFGVDFMVDGKGGVWLMEVNAFPDFAMTGEGKMGREMVGGFWKGAVGVAVRPWCGLEEERGEMVECLGVDLGRR